MRCLIPLLLPIASALPIFSQVTADFTAVEALCADYVQKFDSEEEVADWTFDVTNTSSRAASWHLTERIYYQNVPSFSSIDAESRMSLAVAADYNSRQREVAATPIVPVGKQGRCEFYACFGSEGLKYNEWGFACRIVNVATGEKTPLLEAADWAESSRETAIKWRKFAYDLSAMEGAQVKFEFEYWGQGGGDVYIDNFCLQSIDADFVAEIEIGESVAFVDCSSGNPTEWLWTFDGGMPSQSVEQHPVVRYDKSGVYAVSLSVGDGVHSSTCEKPSFVKVRGRKPEAKMIFEEGYLSPEVGCFIPVGSEVRYFDDSADFPTNWMWHFPGGTPDFSLEQNPVVRYADCGVFDVSLSVANDAGVSSCVEEKAVQVGGVQRIWNIYPEERASIAPIELQPFGYYAGTNMLGMTAFAERFSKPMETSEIAGVAVLFSLLQVLSDDAEVRVAVCAADGGLPGNELASVVQNAGDLSVLTDENGVVQFEFPKKAIVDGAFFVVVSGIPNKMDGDNGDKVAIACVNRGNRATNTACHYDAEGWKENLNGAVSMAVMPLLRYNPDAAVLKLEVGGESMRCDGSYIYNVSGTARIFSLSGMLVQESEPTNGCVSVGGLLPGLYIATDGVSTIKIAICRN